MAFSVDTNAAPLDSSRPRSQSPSRWRSRLRVLRPVPWVVGIALVYASATGIKVYEAKDPQAALVASFAAAGLTVEHDDVRLLRAPSMWWGTVRGVARGNRDGEPHDIYYFSVRMTTDGKVLGQPRMFNLTSTAAQEGPMSVSGQKVAFSVQATAGVVGVRVLDLAGQGPLEGSWTWLSRTQNALTNYQNTGQLRGVHSSYWAIDPPMEEVKVGLAADGWVEVSAGGKQSRALARGGAPIGDFTQLVHRPSEIARPGNLVTWAVDRVRAMPWFGDERMQMLKTVAFGALDVYRRAETSVLGDSSEKEVAADLGDIVSRNPPTTFTDPETGWPPPPIEPFLRKPMEGEGKWIALENDPFIPTNPGVPPAFLTSFVRTDRERSYTRIYVTMWDPRQVQLHMVAGSVEPKGASGEAGPGMIPRKPEVMERVVAGLNGGFQAMHGEWGMMGDGVMYLPPKPFAATIAESSDEDTLFGTWPNDETIPLGIVGYRQNLTPLVMDGKINPYRRTWWGGTPPEWEDRVNTTRTGICLTKEGFVAYFYGNEIDMMPVAQAMVQARCQYGLHLDMNPGHTGLEFYTVRPTELLGSLGRPLDRKWEAEGKVPHMPGWSFRARRMVRFMGLMNFPRYIQREARDYFYLTLRHVLPGADLTWEGLSPEEGKWRTSGLPQHGFPYAVATTHVTPEPSRPGAKVLLVKLDPRTVKIAQGAGSESGSGAVVVSFSNATEEPGKPTLWLGNRTATIASAAPKNMQGMRALVSGVNPSEGQGQEIVAALGIIKNDGMVIYAEVQEQRVVAEDGALLDAVLTKAGCTERILLSKSLLPTFGQQEEKGPQYGRTVRLERAEAPGAKRFFTDTPVVDPKEWQPLQYKRIRYFRKPKEE